MKESCKTSPFHHRSVDDNHGKDEVTGSSPVGGSMIYDK
jgi:hypothetical protein